MQDTGVSVRKRVIQIFSDICLSQPDFDKIPEVCIRMIGRINDEETIKVSLTWLKFRLNSVWLLNICTEQLSETIEEI